MASDNFVAVVGNLTRDPESKTIASGQHVTNFSLAVNEGTKTEERTSFFEVTAWDYLAVHIAESLSKGDRVAVTGRLSQQTWEKDGEKRSKVIIVAYTCGPELRFVTSQTHKSEDGHTSSSGKSSRPASRVPSWDEEPF